MLYRFFWAVLCGMCLSFFLQSTAVWADGSGLGLSGSSYPSGAGQAASSPQSLSARSTDSGSGQSVIEQMKGLLVQQQRQIAQLKKVLMQLYQQQQSIQTQVVQLSKATQGQVQLLQQQIIALKQGHGSGAAPGTTADSPSVTLDTSKLPIIVPQIKPTQVQSEPGVAARQSWLAGHWVMAKSHADSLAAILVACLVLVLLGVKWQCRQRSTKKQASESEKKEQEYDQMAGVSGIPAQLDLALAYVQMKDPASAQAILEKVLLQGNAEQRQQAQDLMRQCKQSL